VYGVHVKYLPKQIDGEHKITYTVTTLTAEAKKMLDIHKAKQSQHDYYADRAENHQADSLAAITQFEFSDPARVPELFREFAVETQNLERYRRVDLDKLNAQLNELWQGPHSLVTISDIVWDHRIQRREQGRANTAEIIAAHTA